MPLPEGFSATPDGVPEGPPEGFSAAPPQAALPEGFSATPQPPPPEGFSYANPLHPDKEEHKEAANTEVPGFWGSMGSAFGRGFTQNIADAAAGAKIMLPPGSGGKTLEEQNQEGLLHPETKDEIDHLMGQKIYSGWSDPKWWAVNIAHGAGGMVPPLAAGALGSPLGPVGMIGGFASESSLAALVPAYKAARAAGLDPEAATQRALIDSGIAAAGATAMGLAPGYALFGRVGGEAAAEAATVAASAFKRPVMEALAQLGLVQPLIGDAQHLVTSLSHGEIPGTEEMLTTHALGTGMGAVPVGAHAVIKAANGIRIRPIVEQPPASPESINEAFHNQQTTPQVIAEPAAVEGVQPSKRERVSETLDKAVDRVGAPDNPEAPEAPESASEETLHPKSREERIFYSAVKEAVEKKVPDNASPEQVIGALKNHPGVKEEEIMDLGLPGYLADVGGKVNKKDLLAHIESQGVVLEEVMRGGEYNGPFATEAERLNNRLIAQYGGLGEAFRQMPQEALDHFDAVHERATAEINQAKATRPRLEPEYPSQVLPGEHSNYREFVLKTPPKGTSSASIEMLAEELHNREMGVSHDYGSSHDKQYWREKAAEELKADVYTNSHWPDDINPIVHIRLTDREGRNGERLLHVEEIQSDLHQTGAKEGYKESGLPNKEDVLHRQRESNKVLKDIEDGERAGRIDGPTSLRLRNEWGIKRAPITQDLMRLAKNADKVPDLPFKTSWQELAVKRILRLAAEEGYDGISLSNGDQVGLRLGTADQLKGARESYDKKLPSLFKKWANKVGAETGYTKLEGVDTENLNPMHRNRLADMGLDPLKLNDRNFAIKVNPAMGERVKMGFSLYDKGAQGKYTLSEAFMKGMPKELAAPGKKIAAAIAKLGEDLHLSLPMDIVIKPMRATWRGHAVRQNGRYTIEANTRLLRSPEDLYATLGHELAHVIYWDKYSKAPMDIRLQVEEAFRKFRTQMTDEARTVGDVRRVRDNAVSEMTGGRNPLYREGLYQNDLPLADLTPGSRRYLLHFTEWFAEQGAKWATTSEKPLSRLDKFFAALGKTVRNLLEQFQKLRGKSGTAEKVMQEWLDSLVHEDTKIVAAIKDQTALEGLRNNQAALVRDGTPEVTPTPQTASTVGGRNIVDNLPPSAKGAGDASAAHGDRMNKFYSWMTSLPQIAEMNKHIRGLTLYKEGVALMNRERNDIGGMAAETLQSWKAIRDPKQQVALGKFIDDYMNGFFKDPSDTSGEVRRPTHKEFSDLAIKHKLSDQSIKVFDRVRGDFDNFLESYRTLLLEDANRIKDPEAQMKARESINRRVDNLLQRPYFPAMRFGKYTITVYDSAGNVRHFEQTESLRKQRKIAEALGKSNDLLPGDRVRTGEVPKDAAPLLGMPPGLLDLMADKLDLSTTQRDMLDQLRFDYAPSQSFRHQFKSKDLTPGYSSDFQRAYANFFFHGANHISRVRWVDALRDRIREVKAQSVDMNDAVKRDRIANYMTEHLSMLVDPKPDFAALRGLMFHWYLGFNPASAALNLSQTPLMTFPHLASKFGGLGVGDFRAAAALAKASLELNNFYKKGTLLDRGKDPQANAKSKALAEAVKEGVISETQAHTLAAVSEGRNLLQAFGSKAEERWQKFSEASSWMFEMTEQYNRRVAFRAAWDLAMKDPNNKYVLETVRDNPLQYKRLRDMDWSHQEAAAFTAAKHTTEATQFVYAPYSRPKFMWGRKGALFIFKSFTQNTLFNLYNNPAGAARTLLILGGLGGLMGLPGTEDLNGILKALAWRLFGKDFDLEDEVRKFAVDVLHGAIGPDMLLHGMSTKGFGIPHVLNALGGAVGLPRFAGTPDMHGNIGMGNILPFEPGKLFGPSKDIKTNELAQLQRASGAGFSNIFALYNFLTSQSSWSDMKEWEKIMPRAASNVSHAFRYWNEGKERNKSGNSIVRFDVNDTEHMSEILLRAAGFQPRRLIAEYEQIQGKAEAATYWDLRKGIILRQFSAALKGGNPEEKASVLQAVKNYNAALPADAKAKSITLQVLKESVMSRARTSAKQEAGLPTSKQNYQMFKNMDKYYPEGRPTGLTNVTPVK